VLLGLGGLAQQLVDLWALWTNDALRSFGLLLPLAAICLAAMQFKSGTGMAKAAGGIRRDAAAVALAINSATHTPHFNFLFSGTCCPCTCSPWVRCFGFISPVQWFCSEAARRCAGTVFR